MRLLALLLTQLAGMFAKQGKKIPTVSDFVGYSGILGAIEDDTDEEEDAEVDPQALSNQIIDVFSHFRRADETGDS